MKKIILFLLISAILIFLFLVLAVESDKNFFNKFKKGHSKDISLGDSLDGNGSIKK